ncbi:MAG: hypothetical protein K6A36_06830 [Paludibacteraceae bacterium]|nr:hypothetical protein [Paludibacteraceae bacterium]
MANGRMFGNGRMDECIGHVARKKPFSVDVTPPASTGGRSGLRVNCVLVIANDDCSDRT